MTKNTLLAAISACALALTTVACSETATNTNTANRNQAVVTNANANTNARVANENKSKEVSREDFEKEKDRYGKEAKDAGSKIGQGANDLWLWTKTRAALLAADDLRDSTINVDVENDAVTLRGTVANQTQKSRAETVAKGIEGVKSVKNSLAVSADGSTANDNSKKEAPAKKS